MNQGRFHFLKLSAPKVFLLLLALLLIYIWLSGFSFSKPWQANNFCGDLISIEQRVVRGDSLRGIVESGEKVQLIRGFYICNEPQRGDLVAYNYSGNAAPLVKRIVGLPGDRFELRADARSEIIHVAINGRFLETVGGDFYALSEAAKNLLRLYERDYKRVIPAGSYLILGNVPTGTLDSTRFGFVGRADLIGKVLY